MEAPEKKVTNKTVEDEKKNKDIDNEKENKKEETTEKKEKKGEENHIEKTQNETNVEGNTNGTEPPKTEKEKKPGDENQPNKEETKKDEEANTNNQTKDLPIADNNNADIKKNDDQKGKEQEKTSEKEPKGSEPNPEDEKPEENITVNLKVDADLINKDEINIIKANLNEEKGNDPKLLNKKTERGKDLKGKEISEEDNNNNNKKTKIEGEIKENIIEQEQQQTDQQDDKKLTITQNIEQQNNLPQTETLNDQQPNTEQNLPQEDKNQIITNPQPTNQNIQGFNIPNQEQMEQMRQMMMIQNYLLTHGCENGFINNYLFLTNTDSDGPDPSLPQIENGRVKLPTNIPSLGLQNVGATCYMNSTLECLIHIKELSELLLSAFLINYPRQNEKYASNHKLSNCYITLLSNVFFPKLNGNTNKFFAPYEMKNLISEINPLFQGIAANDAKDLLQCLLENLHQELKMSTQYFSEYIVDQKNVNATLQYFFNSYVSQNKSPIHDILYGINKIESICLKCKTRKYNFQSYNLLYFPLKEAKRKAVLRKKAENKDFDEEKYILNLEDCFAHSEQVDHFHGDNQMFCNDCYHLEDADYQTTLYTVPKVMSIVLNRGRANLDFQEEFIFGLDLDIKKYIHNDIYKHGKYYLIGMVVHSGESSMAGHFIAYCRMDKNSKWFCYNDAWVYECDDIEKKLSENSPYILFYHYDDDYVVENVVEDKKEDNKVNVQEGDGENLKKSEDETVNQNLDKTENQKTDVNEQEPLEKKEDENNKKNLEKEEKEKNDNIQKENLKQERDENDKNNLEKEEKQKNDKVGQENLEQTGKVKENEKLEEIPKKKEEEKKEKEKKEKEEKEEKKEKEEKEEEKNKDGEDKNIKVEAEQRKDEAPKKEECNKKEKEKDKDEENKNKQIEGENKK